MKFVIYVGITTRGKEELLISAGINRRLVEISRDVFMMKNVDFNSKIYPVDVEVKPDHEERIVLPDEQKMETGVTLPQMPKIDDSEIAAHHTEQPAEETEKTQDQSVEEKPAEEVPLPQGMFKPMGKIRNLDKDEPDQGE